MPRRSDITRVSRPVDRPTEFRETLAPPAPTVFVERQEPIVAEVQAAPVAQSLPILELIVSWITGLIATLLAIRFVFSLADTGQSSGFSNFIYSVTNGFTQPFNALFNYHPLVGQGNVDVPALAAIVATAIIGSVVMALLRVSRD